MKEDALKLRPIWKRGKCYSHHLFSLFNVQSSIDELLFLFLLLALMLQHFGLYIKDDFFRNVFAVVAYAFQLSDGGKDI